ncbi:MAG TPA: DoxX family protein [Candidatus Dormibacteraeota bacterium]|jgi:putative oxidoreductase|nr:DoxX family protein [Candidatus Dormibacteraeota bacterium]
MGWLGWPLRAVQSSWRSVDVAALVLRVALGVVFVAHGGQKLFGWFGGGGIRGTTAFFQGLGIPSPHAFAYVVGITEFFGGVFLLAGFLTVVACIGLITDMAVAIARVSHAFGFFSQTRVGYGWELNLALIGLAAALLVMGAGTWSLDAALGLTRRRAAAGRR